MITYVKGDLFEAEQYVIAHGCNCIGGFGSGVAKIMSNEHPEAREKYLEKFQKVGWKLGEVQFVDSRGKIIANCATQQKYGRDNIRYCSYDAIKTCMETLAKFSREKNLSIAMPKIGAGLANGDWKIIEKIIEEAFQDQTVYVYYL